MQADTKTKRNQDATTLPQEHPDIMHGKKVAGASVKRRSVTPLQQILRSRKPRHTDEAELHRDGTPK
jgi:hypothetical protein